MITRLDLVQTQLPPQLKNFQVLHGRIPPHHDCLRDFFAVPVFAEEPPREPLQAVVDYHVNQQLTTKGIAPAVTLEDVAWLRRVTLDLAGRIPSQSEVVQFRADKRELAVDRLMSSPDYAYHERNFLDSLLQSQYDGDHEWRAWLLRSVRDGRSWHEMFRTIMNGNDDNSDEKPALAFLKRRAKDIDAMTNDASRLFFGVSINCAQCHDHPLFSDWKSELESNWGHPKLIAIIKRTAQCAAKNRCDAVIPQAC